MAKRTNLTYPMVYADIRAAEMAYDEFKQNGVRDIKNISAYHIQQAFEKMIKIQLYALGKALDQRVMYGHSLGHLIRYADKNSFPIYTSSYLRKNCEVITDWEAGSRYDDDFSVRITTLKKAIREARVMYHILTDKEVARK